MENSLPNGWVETTFDEICDYVQRGKSPKYVDWSEFPVLNQKAIRWNGIQSEHLKFIHPDQWNKFDRERFLKVGDIVWNSTGTGTIGRAAFIDQKEVAKAKVVDSHVTIVRANKNISSRYIFYWISSSAIQNQIEELNTGSTNQIELSRARVLKTTIPLAPLKEQQRIVAKLDELMEKIDRSRARLECIPKILKRFRQSILSAAISGKLTEEWRRKNKIEENFKSLLFEEVIFQGPQNGMYKPQSFYGTGSLILRIDNFYDGRIKDWKSLKRLEVSQSEIKLYGLENDDIIINRVNSMPFLGKSGIVKKLKETCVFESNMMRIKLNLDKADPDYIVLFLTSLPGLEELRKNAKQAVNQASINQQDVKSVEIPLPSTKEQKEIVRIVEQLFANADKIETRYNKAKAQIDKLPQSLLAKAFRGELVAQDTNDESAGVLLERIRGEKQMQTKSKKKTKEYELAEEYSIAAEPKPTLRRIKK